MGGGEGRWGYSESPALSTWPRNREPRTQKLKFHLLRSQRLNVLSLKPGVVQYIQRDHWHFASFCLTNCFLYAPWAQLRRGAQRPHYYDVIIIAIHATLTARDFFLANFYSSGPFTCIFSKTSPEFVCVRSCVRARACVCVYVCVLAVANTGSCEGP